MIWIVESTSCHPTHANDFTTRASMVASDAALFVFVLCPLNILPVQIDDDGSSGAEALWAAGSAVPMLCPVHRSVQIVRF